MKIINNLPRKLAIQNTIEALQKTTLTKTGDSADNTLSFTSADSASPTAWTNVDLLNSGEKHSSILNKISTMFQNVRYLYKMLGTTDISAIGDGSCTGAIAAFKSKVTCFRKYTINVNENIVTYGTGCTTVIGDIAIVQACFQTRNTILVNEPIISTGLPAKEGVYNFPCIYYNIYGNAGTCVLTISTDGSIMPGTELPKDFTIHAEFCYIVA